MNSMMYKTTASYLMLTLFNKKHHLLFGDLQFGYKHSIVKLYRKGRMFHESVCYNNVPGNSKGVPMTQ